MYRISKEKQSGQALLIAILLATIVLTVGLSAIRMSRDETQITKLEEDRQRAYAAAEAGLDAAINRGANIQGESFTQLFREGSDITGQAIFDTTTTNSFTTPTIPKDGTYTFYAGTYDRDTHEFSDSFSGVLSVNLAEPTGDYCNDNGGVNALAVELTFVSATNGIRTRKLIDDCSPQIVDGTATDRVKFGETIDTSAFGSIDLITARIIAPNIGFEGAKLQINNLSGDWPLQGRTIESTAQTAGKVRKTIRLFQSYPQSISEFFDTNF